MRAHAEPGAQRKVVGAGDRDTAATELTNGQEPAGPLQPGSRLAQAQLRLALEATQMRL